MFVTSGVAIEGMKGQMSPTFSQDSAWDFFKIDEKIIEERGNRRYSGK